MDTCCYSRPTGQLTTLRLKNAQAHPDVESRTAVRSRVQRTRRNRPPKRGSQMGACDVSMRGVRNSSIGGALTAGGQECFRSALKPLDVAVVAAPVDELSLEATSTLDGYDRTLRLRADPNLNALSKGPD